MITEEEKLMRIRSEQLERFIKHEQQEGLEPIDLSIYENMNMKLKLNRNTDYVHKILHGIEKKNGYCPCQIEKTPKSKCPFEYQLPYEISIDQLCINGYEEKKCHCKLYV